MKNFIFQPFHLVTLSPWPILISINLGSTIIGVIKIFNFNTKYLFIIRTLSLIICSYLWWQDIVRERTFQGYHSIITNNGIQLGIILFIVSEIFFFFSFFWSYFHIFLAPSIEIGETWPPTFLDLLIISPYELPLLNTILLVRSGIFLTIAHYSLLKKDIITTDFIIILTIIFAILFTCFQLEEYSVIPFTINNRNYRSTFFIITGFHGIHVIIGTIFLIISYFRIKIFHFSNIHHSGFELRAWYWHFVDVVWLFLFLFIYWWPY